MALLGRMKGFALSMDAIIAVLIAVTATAAVVSVLSTSESQAYSNMPLHRTAQDALTLMDKQGTLKSFFTLSTSDAQSEINDTFSYYLPPHMKARMNVTIYSYNSSVFTATKNFSFSQGTPGDHVSSARRMFVEVQSNRYGLAEMEVWYD